MWHEYIVNNTRSYAHSYAKSPPTHIFIDFDAYKGSFAKRLCTFMENVWLLDPALEVFENIAACRNKLSQTREHVLLAILICKNTRDHVGVIRHLPP